MVLKSPDIPSMLVETAYISNPQEERRLRGPQQQAKLAPAIHQGVRAFFSAVPPSGTRIAELAAAAPRQALATTARRAAHSSPRPSHHAASRRARRTRLRR